MDGVESQIAEWRAYVAKAPAVNGRDVDELEAHLRDQIAELDAAGLDADEAFLVAVKRMGDLDTLSREFAREHRGRLWKQLVLGGEDETVRRVQRVDRGARLRPGRGRRDPGRTSRGAVPRRGTGVAAAQRQPARVAVPRRVLRPPTAARHPPMGRSRPRRSCSSALVVNLYPYRADSATELLVALHLPVVLWFAVAYPYMGGTLRSHERRMDFVRFTGEWFIYYVLIALGGGVLLLLTALIFEPIGTDVAERVVEWVLPAGAAGAVIVAAWLVESKQHVVENMAPVLTMLFTPLFAVMLTVAAATYAVSGVAGAFDRELLGVFDALLVVVLGLVLYAMSAREPSRPAGPMDRVQLLAVASALVLDVMVLGAMVARIGDLGLTPNRVAALGLNLVLLVNLAGAAWLSLRFLIGRLAFHRARAMADLLPPRLRPLGGDRRRRPPAALRLRLTDRTGSLRRERQEGPAVAELLRLEADVPRSLGGGPRAQTVVDVGAGGRGGRDLEQQPGERPAGGLRRRGERRQHLGQGRCEQGRQPAHGGRVLARQPGAEHEARVEAGHVDVGALPCEPGRGGGVEEL